MPKQTHEDAVPISVRVDPETDHWIQGHAYAKRESANRVVGAALRDLRTVFGLSQGHVALLAADAREKGIPVSFQAPDGRTVADWRPYIFELLSAQVTTLAARKAERPPAAKK